MASLIPFECCRCSGPIKKDIYDCCQCKLLQLCEKCFKEFKSGENYKVDESKKGLSDEFNALQMQKHSEDHPILITNEEWVCENEVNWREIPFYENDPNDKYSYLYDFPKK